MNLKIESLFVLKATQMIVVTHYSTHQMENLSNNIIRMWTTKYFNKTVFMNF